MRIKNTLNRPPIAQSTANCIRMQSKLTRPLGDCLLLPVNLQQVIGARVVALLGHRSPSAVFRRIRPVVINSFDGHSVWTLAHVGQEVDKPISPTLTDSDTTSPVVAIFGSVGIVAPSNHRVVHRFHWMIRQTVRSAFTSSKFASQASAALRLAVKQVSFLNIANRAAITLARPVMHAVRCPGVFDNYPSTKTATDKISRRPINHTLSGSGVTAYKPFWLSLNPSKACVVDGGDWGGQPATAFTQLDHVTPYKSANCCQVTKRPGDTTPFSIKFVATLTCGVDSVHSNRTRQDISQVAGWTLLANCQPSPASNTDVGSTPPARYHLSAIDTSPFVVAALYHSLTQETNAAMAAL